MILGCAAGKTNTVVAGTLRLTKQTVGKWRTRFLATRLDGLLDEPRPGAPRTITDAQVERVLTRTLETTPADATHWSTRSMAKASGLSRSAVHRIWRAFALQPHRTETFKLSTDPLFIEKVRDIVGLYLNPPDRALVLCVDEKSQIQALDRTQPLLADAAGPGGAAPRLHRGTARPRCSPRSTRRRGRSSGNCIGAIARLEFRKFLDTIDGRGPRRPGRASDPRQLRHPQDRPDSALADEAASLPRALHADQRLVAQPRRALVCRSDREADQAGAHPSTRALEAAIRQYIAVTNEAPQTVRAGRRQPMRSSPASHDFVIGSLGRTCPSPKPGRRASG